MRWSVRLFLDYLWRLIRKRKTGRNSVWKPTKSIEEMRQPVQVLFKCLCRLNTEKELQELSVFISNHLKPLWHAHSTLAILILWFLDHGLTCSAQQCSCPLASWPRTARRMYLMEGELRCSSWKYILRVPMTRPCFLQDESFIDHIEGKLSDLDVCVTISKS